jgi:aspartyl-tRNA(Asn)/glutamyl-tRNA(Gln) amidotransferase subunit A
VALTQLMAHIDFLVLPTCSCVAPKIEKGSMTIGRWSGTVREALMTYTAPFNLTGFPAITIPMPVPDGSLPAGLQVVARHGEDGVLLAFAATLEKMLEMEEEDKRNGSPINP